MVHPGGIKTNIARNARVTETKGFVDVKSTRDFEYQRLLVAGARLRRRKLMKEA